MNNIDYNKLGAIGAEAAQKAMKTWHVLTVSKNHSSWENDESARTAYAKAVVRAYLEQVGEGFPSASDCLQALPTSPTIGQGVEAIRSLMLAAFAKKLEEGTGAWASIAAENLTIAQAKLEAVAKLPEKWRSVVTGSGFQSVYATCAINLEDALSLPAVEVEPAEKWAKEKAAHAQGCKGLSIALNDTRERLVKSEKTIESKHGCWMNELAKVTALEHQLSEALAKQATLQASFEMERQENGNLRESLATVTAERDSLQWKPVSVKPTLEDADGEGFVIIYGPKVTQKMFWRAVGWGSETRWLPFSPPPSPTPEDAERERFEVWAQDKPHLALNRGNGFAEYFSSTTQAAWIGWQAARAVKEGE